MHVTVNDSRLAFETPVTVADLIAHLALGGKRVAVERNGELVPRSLHGTDVLADGDRIEIVVAVGGG
ncbi:MAG: sulfur carrier protein ThiS [Burkholderiales bacterium]